MAQIQIDEELFIRLVRYFLSTDDEHRLDRGELARREIVEMLRDRFDRYAVRHFYQKYKHAPTADERERYLHEYIDMRNQQRR